MQDAFDAEVAALLGRGERAVTEAERQSLFQMLKRFYELFE